MISTSTYPNSMHNYFVAGIIVNCKMNFGHTNESNITYDAVMHVYEYTAMFSALVR